MTQDVTLIVYTPEKTALNRKVYRVVLPYGTTNLTVLPERAPTSLVTHAGVMQILNEDDSVAETYFIDSGVVDIADNVCKISTAHLIEHDAITAEEADAHAAVEPQNAVFYNAVMERLKAFG